MPSWNIHIAHTEQLLSREGAVSRNVKDRNAFLFGSLLPDILVGYMVPGLTEAQKMPYRITHVATPEPIPKPREHEFWERWVAPQLADEVSMDRGIAPAVSASSTASDAAVLRRAVLDMTLGAWSHLLADNLWNTRVNEYLDARGGKPSESFRIKKQADFDWFGRTLPISSVPVETPELVRAAEAFPQYPVEAPQVHDAIVVAYEIVRSATGIAAHAPYLLLSDDFFDKTFAEVSCIANELVEARVERGEAAVPAFSSR